MPADKNTASLNLIMGDFVANASPVPSSGAPPAPYCPVNSLAFVVTGGVRDDADGQVTLAGKSIHVKRNNPGSKPIVITLNVSCPDGINYNPQTIVFVEAGGGVGDPNGNQNFTDRTPANQSITFKNQIKHKGAGAVWKYYIQIKQMAGAQLLGWIDPDVQNDL